MSRGDRGGGVARGTPEPGSAATGRITGDSRDEKFSSEGAKLQVHDKQWQEICDESRG